MRKRFIVMLALSLGLLAFVYRDNIDVNGFLGAIGVNNNEEEVIEELSDEEAQKYVDILNIIDGNDKSVSYLFGLNKNNLNQFTSEDKLARIFEYYFNSNSGFVSEERIISLYSNIFGSKYPYERTDSFKYNFGNSIASFDNNKLGYTFKNNKNSSVNITYNKYLKVVSKLKTNNKIELIVNAYSGELNNNKKEVIFYNLNCESCIISRCNLNDKNCSYKKIYNYVSKYVTLPFYKVVFTYDGNDYYFDNIELLEKN